MPKNAQNLYHLLFSPSFGFGNRVVLKLHLTPNCERLVLCRFSPGSTSASPGWVLRQFSSNHRQEAFGQHIIVSTPAEIVDLTAGPSGSAEPPTGMSFRSVCTCMLVPNVTTSTEACKVTVAAAAIAVETRYALMGTLWSLFTSIKDIGHRAEHRVRCNENMSAASQMSLALGENAVLTLQAEPTRD